MAVIMHLCSAFYDGTCQYGIPAPFHIAVKINLRHVASVLA